MREILFRGKRIDNGEWVEGAYCKHDTVKICFSSDDPKTKHLIITDGFCDWGFEPPLTGCEVDPETIGQYTGLTDKNGKRIFEGDIVAQSWYDFNEPTDDSFGEVVYVVGDCSFSVLDSNKNEITSLGQGFSYHWEIEVIGNIHDNSELLKGENNV